MLGQVLGGWGSNVRERKKREERKEKREDIGESVSHVIWISRHYLMIILISFKHFNSINNDMC